MPWYGCAPSKSCHATMAKLYTAQAAEGGCTEIVAPGNRVSKMQQDCGVKTLRRSSQWIAI